MTENIISDFDKISKEIDATIIKNMGPQLKKELKKRFETFFSNFMMGEMELKIVIDANIVLDAAISITEGKRNKLPFLESPHLKIYAPLKITDEVFKHIPEKAKKRNIDEKSLTENASRIIEKIHLLDPNMNDLIKAQILTQNKDKDDAPYIGLIFTTKATGVITNNTKDFSNIDGVKIVRINETSNVLTNFEHGTFSLFVFSSTIPAITTLFFELLSLVFNAIIEFVKKTLQLIALALTKGVEAISEGGIELVALLLAVILLCGKEIAIVLKEVWSKIIVFFRFICVIFREIFEFLVTIGVIIAEFAKFMIIKINVALELSQKINIESAGAYD